jgi:uncharacterized protein
MWPFAVNCMPTAGFRSHSSSTRMRTMRSSCRNNRSAFSRTNVLSDGVSSRWMPDTIISWVFWLFMFLRIGSGEAKTGRSPALRKNSNSSLSLDVSSLRTALQPFSAVVITGGSSGIGKSFIELCATLKPDLFFCNLSRRAPAKNFAGIEKLNLNHFACDLAVPAQVERAAAEVIRFLAQTAPVGQVLLINNSGYGTFGRFPEPDLATELGMIDVNVRALVQFTGLLLPTLRARGGVILNVASTVAFQPTPGCATYGATKAFVLNWSVALNEELRGSRVRTLAVCPGTTRTEFFQRAGVGGAERAPFAMTSERVAEIALHALATRRAVVVTGWRNKLMTFAGAKSPKAFAARVSGRVIARLRGMKGPA